MTAPVMDGMPVKLTCDNCTIYWTLLRPVRCGLSKARSQKKVPQVREGERGKAFGDEIHSDVWGPAQIKTLGGRLGYTLLASPTIGADGQPFTFYGRNTKPANVINPLSCGRRTI
jgi:hypothetical protein